MGYNRDKKKGTMQVVYGLLCDFQGQSVSLQAFPANTVEEGIDELTTLYTRQVTVKGSPILHNIPSSRPSVERLLAAAQVELPTQLANRGVTVSTRKTLVEERKTA